MDTLLLADNHPTGAGLAVVGVILLVMLLAVLAVAFLAARFVIRKVRDRP
ncbi:MAG TPA: hypothetical protein VM938_00620 [Acidimicrobiales bacterium]|nr:hypothetical protein [Acidimicrobiales bacterium]